ncbi:MAG TPA: transposase, partial [Candidatus Binatia bacterium]|nr:transposase [Candidatus Binatia bacterium]
MQRTPPLPPELWEQIPPHVRAVLGLVFEGYERRIARLEREVAELREQVRKTSRNSSKPPSTDGRHSKRKPPKAPSGRKPGGPPGHPLHRRALVPLERVNEVVTCQPTHCRRCGQRVDGQDTQPLRHQVMELPPITVQVTEYQVHRLYCPGCGITTCGQLPAGVPVQGYGPRFTSLIALCSGAYRMSKRQIARFGQDVLGIPLATGEVCKIEQRVKYALRPAVRQARAYVQAQHTNIDETPWRERARRRWLWAAVTEKVSVFQIAPVRGGPVLRELLGPQYPGVVTSDRAKAYDTRPLGARQLCWAHLRREFQAMIDRGGPAKPVGELL